MTKYPTLKSLVTRYRQDNKTNSEFLRLLACKCEDFSNGKYKNVKAEIVFHSETDNDFHGKEYVVFVRILVRVKYVSSILLSKNQTLRIVGMNILKKIYHSKYFPRIFYVKPDGGKDSGVTGYFLIEWKWLFSIAILKFEEGSREAYHSHAFNAYTWWISGKVMKVYIIIQVRQFIGSMKGHGNLSTLQEIMSIRF